MENKILNAAFIDREAFKEINKYTSEGDFLGPSEILFKYIAEYYEADAAATKVDKDIILKRIERKYPKLVENLTTIISEFKSVSVPNVLKEVLDFKRQVSGLKLSSALISGDKIKIRRLVEEYSKITEGGLEEESGQEEAVKIYHNTSFEDLSEAHSKDNLFKVYPKSINDILEGGVVRGTSIAIFARPECGKSLFAINMAAGFLSGGKRVMYVGNEDSSTAMRLRIIGRMTGLTKFEILSDTTKSLELARGRGYENLVYVDAHPGTLSILDSLIQKYKPDALIIDQTRNILIQGETGLVQVLERVAAGIRSLGKKYDMVTVQITQAGDSASGKLMLTMSDVDNSKTGFPAAIDVMIGIGMNQEYEDSNKRMLTLCKNKVSTVHKSWPVTIDPALSKVNN